MEELEKQRKNPIGNNLIASIRRKNSESEIIIKTDEKHHSAHLYFPLKETEADIPLRNGKITLHIPEEVYYFILEFK